MTFAQALELLKGDTRVGIQCKAWKEHPSKRFLFQTGVDSIPMFGVGFQDPNKGYNCYSWSVFMPMWDEIFNQDWEMIDISEFRKDWICCDRGEDSFSYQEAIFRFNR